jgi:hypothetical protein
MQRALSDWKGLFAGKYILKSEEFLRGKTRIQLRGFAARLKPCTDHSCFLEWFFRGLVEARPIQDNRFLINLNSLQLERDFALAF